MPLISIIIPVYNVEKYLSECLDSIMNQTFSDIEIICINDGSTDNSLAYLEKYSQKGSRVIVINQENKGQAVARNIGIKAAKGKYVLFVDSDDWIAQNSCETLLSYLTEDIDLIIFDTNIFGEFDKSMNKYFQPKFSGKLNISGDVILKTPTSPWNKIYRKDVIDKHDISFPEGLLYEDNSFHWKYMMHSKTVFFLNEKLYHYRIRKDSVMGKTKSRFSKVTDHLLVCAEIFEYMEKYNLLEKYADSFASFFECCLCIVCANANNVSESLKMANEIWIKIDIATDNPIICALKNKDYVYVKKWISYSSLEKIFSIKKRYGKKTITVCGIQF